jgi:hypothetical protein
VRREAVAVLACALAWSAGVAGAAPPADVAADPQLRARRDTYHPVIDLLKAKAVRLSDEQMEKLKGFPLEAVWASVQQLGYTNAHMSGLRSTRPGEPLVGRALTIRYLARRPDLVEAMQALAKEGDWPVAYNVRAGDEARPGDVLVVDLGGGVPDGIFFGDISALAAQLQGARGAVLYGSTRDLTELRAMAGFRSSPWASIRARPRRSAWTGTCRCASGEPPSCPATRWWPTTRRSSSFPPPSPTR